MGKTQKNKIKTQIILSWGKKLSFLLGYFPWAECSCILIEVHSFKETHGCVLWVSLSLQVTLNFAFGKVSTVEKKAALLVYSLMTSDKPLIWWKMAEICQILNFKKIKKLPDSYDKLQKAIEEYGRIQLCSYIKVNSIIFFSIYYVAKFG